MRLATFLPPGGPIPSPARSAATRSSRSPRAPCSTGSPPATARPPTATPTRSPTSRCWRPLPQPRAIFGIGLNYAAHAAETGEELPEAPMVFLKLPSSSVPRQRPRPLPGRRQAARLRGRAGRRDGRAAARSPATRSPTTSPPATCRSASRAGSARRASTPPARGARGSRPPTRSPDPQNLRIASQVNGETAPGLDHRRPRLRPAGARRLHRRDLHARARRPDPHRHAAGRRPGDGPAAVPRSRRRRALRDRGPRRDRAPRSRGEARRPTTSPARARRSCSSTASPTRAGLARAGRPARRRRLPRDRPRPARLRRVRAARRASTPTA